MLEDKKVMRINMTLKQGMMLVEAQLSYARNGIKKYKGGTLVGLEAIVNTKGDKPLVIVPKEQKAQLKGIWQVSTADEEFLVASLKGSLTKAVDGTVVPITLYYTISHIVSPTDNPDFLEEEYRFVPTGASITTPIDFQEQKKLWEDYKASKKAAQTPPESAK